MPLIIHTSLGLCGQCIDDPTVDGDCECAVDMPICVDCHAGPLNEGEERCGCCTGECTDKWRAHPLGYCPDCAIRRRSA